MNERVTYRRARKLRSGDRIERYNRDGMVTRVVGTRPVDDRTMFVDMVQTGRSGREYPLTLAADPRDRFMVVR